MNLNLGKKLKLGGNASGVQPAGVCTFSCPIVCKSVSTIYCKCRNDDYANRGTGYSGHYNTEVHNNRTPDFA